jgi:putative ABC transport system permease protein
VAPGELTRTTTENYRIIARLAPGVTLERARGEADALAARIRASYGGNAGMSVDAFIDDVARDVRPALLLLLGAVALLLIIACANLSNLFAARAAARRTEFAVRVALGASRRRLAVQAIAEAVPILVAGGLVGVLLAALAVRLFVTSAPAGLPRVQGIALDGPVMAFSLALLALAGIAASLLPIATAWSRDLATTTREQGRSSTAGRGRTTARTVAVAAQIAFALPLLVGASVMLRSAMRVSNVDPGFAPDRVITFPFEVLRSGHPTDAEVADYYDRLVAAVAALPGVTNVGLVNRIPLAGGQTNPVRFEGATVPPDQLVNVDTRTVTPGYFAAMGIPLLDGRGFDDRYDADAPLVVIVDDRIARIMWPGESAVGKRLREPPWRGSREAFVVGVVAHVRTQTLEEDPLPQVYWSTQQWVQNRMALAVRTVLEPAAMIPAVTRAVRSVDANQSLYDVRTMTAIMDRSQATRRLTTLLMMGFGAAALLLAAVGIYGVIAFGVTQRMREFGIRIAIGATGKDVTRLIVIQGTTVAAAGAALGLAVTLTGAGILRSLVFDVAPRDTWSIVGATIVLLLVAVAASYVPARRAAAADPGMTLRSE